MLKSIQEIAAIAGTNRETVGKRIAQFGLLEQEGPKGAKLFDTRALIQLKPPPSRGEGASTLEEARIRSEIAKAENYELDALRKRGELASVDELLAAQNMILDEISALVKKSSMSDVEKEDCLSMLAGIPKKCWGEI